jgi:hypothetical protein
MNAAEKQPEPQGKQKGSYFSYPSPGMPAYVYVGAGGSTGEVNVDFIADQGEPANEVRVMANPDDDFRNGDPPVGGTPLTQDPGNEDRWTGCVGGVPCNADGSQPFELVARQRYPFGWAPAVGSDQFLGQCAEGTCRAT